MTGSDGERLEQRLLVLAPIGKDAALSESILRQAGLACLHCDDLPHVCRELEAGAGAILLVEEAIDTAGQELLSAWLAAQPAWSDLPILILSRPGADSAAVAQSMDLFGNVTVLERPTRVAAFVSAARTALRARQRQYQVRDTLAERERATELLRESVEQMQTLLDTLPVGVVIAHDPQCERITGNRAATELLRAAPDANLSKTGPVSERPQHFVVCKDGVEVPPAELPVQRAARGETVRNEPLDQVFDDGTVVRSLISASPMFDARGRLRGSVAAILDVTELKRTEELLREADRRKDEFLAILAHELRNPLAPIRNALHILRLTHQGDPAAARVGEMMERQVNLMVRLVDDLMEVSRITRGKIELRKERVAVASIVRGAVETSRPTIDAAGHELTLAIPSDSLAVEGDPVRLTQVVANLLNNAAKYTDPGGRIWLDVRADGGSVAISVRDSGVGIPAEALPRVFDLFTQVGRHATRSQGGLGIGLTLVKRLVEMHGGSVRAYSDGIGRGSEFVIHLPLAARKGATERPDSKATASPQIATRRVLVVDDNHDAANSLGTLLQLLGADVHVVYSGADALERLASYQPSVVFLDIGMPGMDGYEVARRIRQNPAHKALTLIALTGWGQEADRNRSQSAGFDYHMIKPADIGVLETLLASLES